MADDTPTDHAAADATDAAAAADAVEADLADLADVIDADTLDAAAEPVLDPIAAADARAEEYLLTAQRLQADFANFRRRADAERVEAGDRAVGVLIEKLLPVLDTVELARTHGAAEALEQVAGPLFDLLGKEGLEKIHPAGEPFDPTRHDAVAHEEAADATAGPTVAEVFRPGWAWKGRVLRAAMVKVAG